MAKTGILSMHRIINYGSFLQAYALKTLLEESGHDVQFVDYHVGKPLVQETVKKENPLMKKIRKGFEALRYDAPLMHRVQFILYKKNFAKKYFSELGIGENFNYCPKLDTLVIGSDEVFNCVQKNPNVGYSPELFGKNHRAKKLISYAASFGNTTSEKLEQYKKTEEIAGLLQGFDAISVRDNNSGHIVEKLTGKAPQYHLDPVLAYDYMGKCDKIPSGETLKGYHEKYLILYAYSGRISAQEASVIRAYAKKQGWKIYAIGGVHPCADRYIDCSPFEVLAYFGNAQAVVTDTFHGSIFSVITKRKFVTIVRKSVGISYGNEEKLSDLLQRLGLSDRMTADVESVGDIMEQEIDYQAVDVILETERQRTREYLESQI